MRLDTRDASAFAFEMCGPVRSFPSWRGKRNYSGEYWSSTTGLHVGFESLTEKAALMLLDRDPSVVGIASQPMWITWPSGKGVSSHAPDFFVRHSSGSGTVIDVRPRHLIDDRTAAVFAETRRLCDEIGLGYRVMSDFSPALVRNLSFLSRYRSVAFSVSSEAPEGLGGCTTLREVAERVGGGNATDGLAVAYRLVWDGSIDIDLGEPLKLSSRLRHN